MSPLVRRILAIAMPLTFCVIVFGAFVRLTDAGLGCPDWPGCYGQLIGIADPSTASQSHPDSPYDATKALIEVSHRYLASILGLLLTAACFLDWWQRRRFLLPQWLWLLVIAQGLLGMLTVTQLLRPIIVIAHLTGGLLILSLLTAACAKKPLSVALPAPTKRHLRQLWNIAVVALIVQILLGGWVSTNYAGLSCPDFPLCQGKWVPPVLDFSGYHPYRELHQNLDGSNISNAALSTIHWLHRVGAVVLLLTAGAFIIRLWQANGRREARGLAIFLTIQLILGVVNVVLSLPLAAAVAHNAVAAILVANFTLLRVKLA